MFSLLVTALLAQNPSPRVVVLPAARVDQYPHAKGLLLSSRITAFLNAQGVPTLMDAYQAAETLQKRAQPPSETCAGNRECFAALARVLGADVIVSVDAGEVREDLAIHVEAVRAADGQRLVKHGFVIRAHASDVELGRALTPFVEKLRPSLDPWQAPVTAAAQTPPVVASAARSEDRPLVEKPVVLAPEPRVEDRRRDRGPQTVYVAAAATGVVALAAGAFAVTGVAQQNKLNASHKNGQSTLLYGPARTLMNQANSFYTASAITAGVACALAVATAVLWTNRPGSAD